MLKNNRHCDLCDALILGENNNRMIIFEHDYQSWNDKDVCHRCCIVLDRAKGFGLIEYDDTQFEQEDVYFKTTSCEVCEEE
jgi:hypothetical protein